MAKGNKSFDDMMKKNFFSSPKEDIKESVDNHNEGSADINTDPEVIENAEKKRKVGRPKQIAKVTKTYRYSQDTLNALESYTLFLKRDKSNNVSTISDVIEGALRAYIPSEFFNEK